MKKVESVERVKARPVLSLDCALTDAELIERAGQLAKAVSDIHLEESRQESVKREMKARLGELESARDRLGSVVQRREELRDVQCEDTLNLATGRYTRVRLDTGEVIVDRPLSDAERQHELNLSGTAEGETR